MFMCNYCEMIITNKCVFNKHRKYIDNGDHCDHNYAQCLTFVIPIGISFTFLGILEKCTV